MYITIHTAFTKASSLQMFTNATKPKEHVLWKAPNCKEVQSRRKEGFLITGTNVHKHDDQEGDNNSRMQQQA
jgi:hypothetical protein